MTTTVSVNVVEDNPTAGPPVAALVAGWQTGMSSLLMRISWPAATDPSSAIAGYELQTSRNGGAWGSTIAFSAAQREALSSVGFDATYRLRIRAVDSAGNWSPWVQGAADARVQAVDDRSSSLVRRGTWGRTAVSSAYRTTLSGSGRIGASMSMSFTGRAVGFVGPRSPLRGKVKVYIDGHYIQTIDMSSRTTVSRQLAFTRTFASAGAHRIMVVVVGTGSHPLVSVDAFVVLR
jgi:hypothetical protein